MVDQSRQAYSTYLLKTNLEAALVPTHLHTVPTAEALIQALIALQH